MAQDQMAVLKARLRQFAAVRDWEQFHSPKNLATALVAEAGELVAHFQWLTGEQSAALHPAKRDAVAQEMADVMIYLVRLADKLDIDLWQATAAKMELNEQRYPADLVRGSAAKYDEY